MSVAARAHDVIVIGAGLAGAACAYTLAQRGAKVLVLSMGAAASELPAGLMAAHLSADDLPASQLSRVGVSNTLAHCRNLLDSPSDWQSVQVRQQLPDARDKSLRLAQGAKALPAWFEVHADHILHLQAAWIKPQSLVRAWLAHPLIDRQLAHVDWLHFGDQWQALNAKGEVLAEATSVVVAAGVQSAALLAGCGYHLNLDSVDGAIATGSWAQGNALAYSGNGHFVSGICGKSNNAPRIWLSGSTYERQALPSALEQDRQSLLDNRQRLRELIPSDLFAQIDQQFALEQVHSWRGTRCTTSDRLPAVGQLAKGLLVCTAMGSRGLTFAPMCAELIANIVIPDPDPDPDPDPEISVSQTPLPPDHLIAALSPRRKALALR